MMNEHEAPERTSGLTRDASWLAALGKPSCAVNLAARPFAAQASSSCKTCTSPALSP